jgi:hypothetical protein
VKYFTCNVTRLGERGAASVGTWSFGPVSRLHLSFGRMLSTASALNALGQPYTNFLLKLNRSSKPAAIHGNPNI